MISKALIIAKKDFLVEARSRQSIGVTALFTLMVVVAIGVTFSFTGAEITAEWLSILLWIVILFAGSIALGRAFSQETDKHTLDALLLCPIERTDILFGKMVSNFVFMLIVIIESVVLFALFIGSDFIGNIGPVLLVLVMGGVGLGALGTVLSAISARMRAREVAVITMLIPLALFTIVIPGILAINDIHANGVVFPDQLTYIILFNVVYILVGFILANRLFEE